MLTPFPCIDNTHLTNTTPEYQLVCVINIDTVQFKLIVFIAAGRRAGNAKDQANHLESPVHILVHFRIIASSSLIQLE
jgi:hypothetical protein